MPLPSDKEGRFHEWKHSGKLEKARKKFGKKKARAQMIAVALNDGKRKKKRKAER